MRLFFTLFFVLISCFLYADDINIIELHETKTLDQLVLETNSENIEIKNVGGFYGSVISDFLLQSLGLISFLLTFNFLIWGISLLKKKVINNFTTRVFFTLLYLIFGALVLNIWSADTNIFKGLLGLGWTALLLIGLFFS